MKFLAAVLVIAGCSSEPVDRYESTCVPLQMKLGQTLLVEREYDHCYKCPEGVLFSESGSRTGPVILRCDRNLGRLFF